MAKKQDDSANNGQPNCPGGTKTEVVIDEWTDDDGTKHRFQSTRTSECPLCRKYH